MNERKFFIRTEETNKLPRNLSPSPLQWHARNDIFVTNFRESFRDREVGGMRGAQPFLPLLDVRKALGDLPQQVEELSELLFFIFKYGSVFVSAIFL